MNLSEAIQKRTNSELINLIDKAIRNSSSLFNSTNYQHNMVVCKVNRGLTQRVNDTILRIDSIVVSEMENRTWEIKQIFAMLNKRQIQSLHSGD